MVSLRCCVCMTEAKGHRDPLNFLSRLRKGTKIGRIAHSRHRNPTGGVGAAMCAQQKRSNTDTQTGISTLQAHP